MNKVILMGRLTRDPEVRYSQGERSMAIAKYTLAIDRRKTQQNSDPGAVSLTVWRLTAPENFAEKYFRQGLRVLISGHLQTGSYTNKDGQKVYTTDVIVESQEFADSRRDGSGAGSRGSKDDDFMNIPDNVEDEGLPFN